MSSNGPPGFVPESYEKFLVPLLFKPYALDLAERVRDVGAAQVLELACGTGVLTRALLNALDPGAVITATDYSESMVSFARKNILDGRDPEAGPKVIWGTADGCDLPFDDNEFDAVVCQFGVMFFADKQKAFSEAIRVLRPGGRLVFSVWGRMGENPVFESLELALQAEFPEETVPILPTPCSMGNEEILEAMLADAGFSSVELTSLAFSMGGWAAADVASGFVHGTPLSAFFHAKGRSHEYMHGVIESQYRATMGDPISTSMVAIVCDVRV